MLSFVDQVLSQPDVLQCVCKNINTMQHMGMLTRTCKDARDIMMMKPGIPWLIVAKNICGDEYWPEILETDERYFPNHANGRYVAMLRVMPYISEPVMRHSDDSVCISPRIQPGHRDQIIIANFKDQFVDRRLQISPKVGRAVVSARVIHRNLLVCSFEQLEGSYLFSIQPTIRFLRQIAGRIDNDSLFACEMTSSSVNDTIETYIGPRLDMRNVALDRSGHMAPAVWAACNGDHFEMLRVMDSIGLKLDTPEPLTGRTLLHYAVSYNHIAVARVLIFRCNASINPPGGDETPLAMAVRSQHQELVHLLVDRKADVNAVDREGYTPFIRAVDCPIRARKEKLRKKINIVGKLLDAGADVNRVTREKCTALYLHWSRNNASAEFAITKALIYAKADVNFRGPDGRTMLMCGFPWSPLDTSFEDTAIRVLLTKNADINARNPANGNYTALHYAAENGIYSTVELLLQFGADVNLLTDGGQDAADIIEQRSPWLPADSIIKKIRAARGACKK